MAFDNVSYTTIEDELRPDEYDPSKFKAKIIGIQSKYIKALGSLVFIKGDKLEFYKLDLKNYDKNSEDFQHPYLTMTIPELK